MAIYDFPNIKPTTQTFELVTNTKMFQSPLSKAVQTISRKGSHWKTTMQFSNISDDNRSVLQAFITKMQGQVNRMRIRDYGYVRRGAGASNDDIYFKRGTNPAIDNFDLIIGDTNINVTNFFKAGDYITIEEQMMMVTEDASSNINGRIGLYVFPKPRDTFTLDAPVEFVNPRGVFMMTNNPQWNTQAPYISNLTIEAIEDVLA